MIDIIRELVKITVVAAALLAAPAVAATYIEDFEQAPGGTGYAALLGSPNGVTYDFYAARAFPRMAGQPITVLGSGDEAFYWGNNGILPAPAYGLPGGVYSSNPTNYLFNGYGTGYVDYVLGFNFTQGLTVVNSLDFGSANGSNAPAPTVTVRGFAGGVLQWTSSTAVNGNLTLATSSTPVDRIEIDRTDNEQPLFSRFTLGWYTVDNLSYEIAGTPSGDYSWKYYTREEYLAPLGSGTPEPATWAMLIVGFGLTGAVLRRRRSGNPDREVEVRSHSA